MICLSSWNIACASARFAGTCRLNWAMLQLPTLTFGRLSRGLGTIQLRRLSTACPALLTGITAITFEKVVLASVPLDLLRDIGGASRWRPRCDQRCSVAPD